MRADAQDRGVNYWESDEYRQWSEEAAKLKLEIDTYLSEATAIFEDAKSRALTTAMGALDDFTTEEYGIAWKLAESMFNMEDYLDGTKSLDDLDAAAE